MGPELVLLWKVAGVYVVVGILLHIVGRFLEVMEYLRHAERMGSAFYSYKIREAWCLESNYDSSMFGYVWLLVMWPCGILALPFFYGKAIWYMFSYPFKRMNVNLWPTWLTIDSIVTKMNKSRKAKGEIH